MGRSDDRPEVERVTDRPAFGRADDDSGIGRVTDRPFGEVETSRPPLSRALHPPPPPLTHTAVLLRKEDMVALTFRFHNLTVEGGAAGNPVLKRVKAGPALIVVEFPPQHLLEEVVDAADPLPPFGRLRARLSGPSRLAFRVPDATDEIPFTAESLLAWDRFGLRLPVTALGAGQFEVAGGGTRLELTRIRGLTILRDERSQRCQEQDRRIRRNFESRSSRWSGRGGRRRNWLGSLSLRWNRFACG